MKKLSILLISILVAFAACTKSKEVHPELGDGNDEIMTVGMKDVHVEYTRTDHAELQKVVFHYSLAEAQQFAAAEMTKQEEFFELTLNDLLSDTLYYYYYELFPKGGSAFLLEQKKFHTQAYDQPPTPPVAELPTVVTAEVSEITTNSAVCGGEVTNDGGAEVTERGICWSTNANPTLDDSHIAIGTGIGEFVATVSGLDENTTYHVRAYATNEKGMAYGLDREFTTLSGGGGSGDHEYVDLGLPSGTLWATCNVGANSPEEYGDYFAWGETWPKDYYDWSNYQYCMGSYGTLTKYCNDSSYGYNGFTDNLTTLLPEDDAATANWGSGWRMPTKEEWVELYNSTTVAWMTQNSVNGRLFTASNGNSLFLPAAGYRFGSIEGAGRYGYYRSCSLGTDYPLLAGVFCFDQGAWGETDSDRHSGLPVRPVRDAGQK